MRARRLVLYTLAMLVVLVTPSVACASAYAIIHAYALLTMARLHSKNTRSAVVIIKEPV